MNTALMIRISLSWNEVSIAARVGTMRHCEALRAGKKDSFGFKGDGWGQHIEGACGEMAVAKACGVYWLPTVNTYKTGADVASWQVRTRSAPGYELLVRPSDPDDAPFVLARGRCPDYQVVGWIMGRDAKRPEWLQTHGGRPPAYFVPDAALRHIETLREKAVA